MRYYKLVISNAAGQVYVPNALGDFDKVAPGANVSSFASHLPTTSGGLQYNPGSLNLEFDLPVYGYATPQGKSLIRVAGVGLQMIGRASQLTGNNFALYAGMQQGLAGVNGLANPKQAGLIAQGSIFQGFGNWQGVNQTIDLVCNPAFEIPTTWISFSWNPGVPLASALFTTLQQAYPTYLVSVNVTAGLAPVGIQNGSYPTFESFAGYINDYTKAQGAALGLVDYTGVDMAFYGNRILVFDHVTPSTTTQLNFQDLIGQPTWITAVTISFKTVLRADINLGQDIVFPAGIVTPYALTSPDAAVPGAPSRSKTVFQGRFNVSEIHHFANYRQTDAESWNTSFLANAYNT